MLRILALTIASYCDWQVLIYVKAAEMGNKPKKCGEVPLFGQHNSQCVSQIPRSLPFSLKLASTAKYKVYRKLEEGMS
jgi:hypothetical protein